MDDTIFLRQIVLPLSRHPIIGIRVTHSKNLYQCMVFFSSIPFNPLDLIAHGIGSVASKKGIIVQTD